MRALLCVEKKDLDLRVQQGLIVLLDDHAEAAISLHALPTQERSLAAPPLPGAASF